MRSKCNLRPCLASKSWSSMDLAVFWLHQCAQTPPSHFACLVSLLHRRGGKRSKSGHAILENITSSLKRISIIHNMACVVTNHMCVFSCFAATCCHVTHSTFVQCIVSQVFPLHFGVVMVSRMRNVSCSCFSQCSTWAFTAIGQKIEFASCGCLYYVAVRGAWCFWIFFRFEQVNVLNTIAFFVNNFERVARVMRALIQSLLSMCIQRSSVECASNSEWQMAFGDSMQLRYG